MEACGPYVQTLGSLNEVSTSCIFISPALVFTVPWGNILTGFNHVPHACCQGYGAKDMFSGLTLSTIQINLQQLVESHEIM